MPINNNILELGKLVGDLGQVGHVAAQVALPLVEVVEGLPELLGQAAVEDQRDVGRQPHLDFKLIEVVAIRLFIGDQRRPRPLEVGIDLVELQLRQPRRLALDQLAVDLEQLLEGRDVLAVVLDLLQVLEHVDEADDGVDIPRYARREPRRADERTEDLDRSPTRTVTRNCWRNWAKERTW